MQPSETMEFSQTSNGSWIKGQGRRNGTQRELTEEEVIEETVKIVKKKKKKENVSRLHCYRESLSTEKLFENKNLQKLCKTQKTRVAAYKSH